MFRKFCLAVFKTIDVYNSKFSFTFIVDYVSEEHYDEAKRLKNAIEHLKQTGTNKHIYEWCPQFLTRHLYKIVSLPFVRLSRFAVISSGKGKTAGGSRRGLRSSKNTQSIVTS